MLVRKVLAASLVHVARLGRVVNPAHRARLVLRAPRLVLRAPSVRQALTVFEG
jgi:hypothetical protein